MIASVASCPDLQSIGGGVRVPRVARRLSGSGTVLVTELVEGGIPLDEVGGLSRSVRDSVGARVLLLAMREIFTWRHMQAGRAVRGRRPGAPPPVPSGLRPSPFARRSPLSVSVRPSLSSPSVRSLPPPVSARPRPPVSVRPRPPAPRPRPPAQTDPNWGNFLYVPSTDVLWLIDFGAAREYSRAFSDDYLRMVRACAEADEARVMALSLRLGFLDGDEGAAMRAAHAASALVVGEPFSARGAARGAAAPPVVDDAAAPAPRRPAAAAPADPAPPPPPPDGRYDFGRAGGPAAPREASLTARVARLGATMLRHRRTPPPEEAYSLHRKLSGAFLACIKLGARVDARGMLRRVWENHAFADGGVPGTLEAGEVETGGGATAGAREGGARGAGA